MPNALPNWQASPEELSPFAGIRLIAVDLDGSFVHSNSRDVQDLIARLSHGLARQRGNHAPVRVTYATGRSLTWVHGLLQEKRGALPTGTPMVLYNGGLVIEAQTNRLVARHSIRRAAVERIRVIARDSRSILFAYPGPDPVSISRPLMADGSLEHVLGEGPDTLREARDLNGAPISWDAAEEEWATTEPIAVLLRTPVEHLGTTLSRLDQVSGVSATSSGAGFIEVRPSGANKATGLQVVVERLGLQSEQVLALGDNDNDVEMLLWAGVGVAVAGASDRLLATSDFVCRYGAAEGAVEVLRTVKHARKYFG